MPFAAHKVVIESVADAKGLADLIDRGEVTADGVIAVIGKTEGNGGVNDYTRILADQAFRGVLEAEGTRSAAEIAEIPMAWSGGTDGVICPNAVILSHSDSSTGETGSQGGGSASDEPRLTVGIAMSDIIQPEDIGRPAMVTKIAAGVKVAMAEAGITDPADVHYVQTKTPLLTMETINEAKSRGHTVFTEEPLESMAVSNGTTGLGIAVALGEIDMPTAEQIGHDLSLFSSVASCSSGVELDRGQIVVVGNRRGIGGRFRVGHSVMRDAIDRDGVFDAIRSAGLDLPDRPHPDDLDGRVVQVFVKTEADPTSTLRGYRQVMLNDSDVHHHRQIKAAVGGVVASVLGEPAVFVSVAALHQGPAGGGPVAAIVDLG